MTKTTADDLYRKVTDRVVAEIEAGAAEWQMPWHRLATSAPRSVDGRPYRGFNSLLLALEGEDHGYASGVWGTYRAWQKHGAQVRKGERGEHVLLWKPIEKRATDEATGEERTERHLLARTYVVFAAEQVDGYELPEPVKRDTPERLEAAENFFADFPATEGGDRAYYDRVRDEIHLPTFGQFKDAASYYATRAHETTHWTGHETRLDRTFGQRFGDEAYAAEELVAELGSAMWCAEAGISPTPRPDHAQCLAHWLTILRADAKALLTVTSKAQAALDFLKGEKS